MSQRLAFNSVAGKTAAQIAAQTSIAKAAAQPKPAPHGAPSTALKPSKATLQRAERKQQDAAGAAADTEEDDGTWANLADSIDVPVRLIVSR